VDPPVGTGALPAPGPGIRSGCAPARAPSRDPDRLDGPRLRLRARRAGVRGRGALVRPAHQVNRAESALSPSDILRTFGDRDAMAFQRGGRGGDLKTSGRVPRNPHYMCRNTHKYLTEPRL